jgi:hypothetical protein
VFCHEKLYFFQTRGWSANNIGEKKLSEKIFQMCVAGFEQNVQELAGLLRQKVPFLISFYIFLNFVQQAKHEPKETDAIKFAFEMKSYHSADAVLLATHYSSK